MNEHNPVAEPYREPGQQNNAAMLGMYIFLASEVMLFGGIFVVAAAMRLNHPAETVQASRALHLWIGGSNTVILLTSSLFVALGVQAAEQGRRYGAASGLVTAAVAGVAFLVLKAHEYTVEFDEGLLPISGAAVKLANPVQRAFMDLYVIATGLHALHLTIGIGLLIAIAARIAGGKINLPARRIVPTTAGLYWHLIDVVWIFLYPVFYLSR